MKYKISTTILLFFMVVNISYGELLNAIPTTQSLKEIAQHTALQENLFDHEAITKIIDTAKQGSLKQDSHAFEVFRNLIGRKLGFDELAALAIGLSQEKEETEKTVGLWLLNQLLKENAFDTHPSYDAVIQTALSVTTDSISSCSIFSPYSIYQSLYLFKILTEKSVTIDKNIINQIIAKALHGVKNDCGDDEVRIRWLFVLSDFLKLKNFEGSEADHAILAEVITLAEKACFSKDSFDERNAGIEVFEALLAKQFGHKRALYVALKSILGNMSISDELSAYYESSDSDDPPYLVNFGINVEFALFCISGGLLLFQCVQLFHAHYVGRTKGVYLLYRLCMAQKDKLIKKMRKPASL